MRVPRVRFRGDGALPGAREHGAEDDEDAGGDADDVAMAPQRAAQGQQHLAVARANGVVIARPLQIIGECLRRRIARGGIHGGRAGDDRREVTAPRGA